MNVYKLGTRWGKGKPDFYDLIKKESISLSHISDCSPEKDSIILIAKGFTVFAITVLLEDTHPVTDYPDLEGEFVHYEIDYDNMVTFSRSKWFELDENDRFDYQTQDGICQVQKQEIIIHAHTLLNKYKAMAALENLINLLKFKKQIILQGPPGTGKTKFAKEIAVNLISEKLQYSDFDDTFIMANLHSGLIIRTPDRSSNFKIVGIEENTVKLQILSGGSYSVTFDKIRAVIKEKTSNPDTYANGLSNYLKNRFAELKYKIVQFHPSYTYEDFVRGIVAESMGGKIEYKNVNRCISLFAEKALKNYIDYRKSPELVSKEIWVGSEYRKFKKILESDLEKEEEVVIKSGTKPKLTAVEEDSVRVNRYSNEKDSVLIKDSDIINGYVGLNLSNPQIKVKDNQSLSKSARSGMYYLYQNLIEKFRNHLEGGKLTFDPQLPIKKQNLQNYVIVIDEINRANLSSVLGELIYALEYRGEEVESMYEVDGSNSFTLPPNLYIIGTMNTADRSVGHIDYAIRRRFAFVEVLPKNLQTELGDDFRAGTFKDVANLFVKNYNSDLDFSLSNTSIERSEHLNSDFDPKDVWLGHSYFIQQYEKDQNGDNIKDKPIDFNLRIQYEIKPILEEYIKDGILKESARSTINQLK